jgi:hypothetical protein
MCIELHRGVREVISGAAATLLPLLFRWLMRTNLVVRWLVLTAASLAGVALSPVLRADEFLAMPGLWRTTYELGGNAGEIKVTWHCVDEAADPWLSFAQLEDLPGMVCRRDDPHRNSTSLEWKMECHGTGPESEADNVTASGAVIFDSPQHYRGWVKLSGTLLGYPMESGAKIEGYRKAACTSPAD